MDSFLSDLVLVEMLGLQSCCSPQNVTCDHLSPETAQLCPATSTGGPPKAAARVLHGTSDEFWSIPSLLLWSERAALRQMFGARRQTPECSHRCREVLQNSAWEHGPAPASRGACTRGNGASNLIVPCVCARSAALSSALPGPCLGPTTRRSCETAPHPWSSLGAPGAANGEVQPWAGWPGTGTVFTLDRAKDALWQQLHVSAFCQ